MQTPAVSTRKWVAPYFAAMRAAANNRMQTSLNLALGSALATIGLTIPTVALVSIALGIPLSLGIDPKSTVLLFLSLMVAMLSLATGLAIANPPWGLEVELRSVLPWLGQNLGQTQGGWKLDWLIEEQAAG